MNDETGVGVRVGATPEPLTHLLIAIDDDRRAHLTYCAGRGAIVDAVVIATYGEPTLDQDAREEAAGITDALLEDGIFRFEGDPPLHLFELVPGAALRAPEPLTAEPFARVKVERTFGAGTLTVWTWLRGHIDQLPEGEHDLYTARAALEGGVSPQHYGDVKGTFADPTARFETAVQRPAVVEEMYSFICSVADNLGDMPISDQYAEKTSRRAWALMRELSEFVIVADWENAQRVKARLAETQRSSSGARSDKTEMEGGGSRTEPAALKLAKQIRNHQYGVRGFGDGSLQRGRNFTDAEQRVLVAALEQYTGVSRTEPALTDALSERDMYYEAWVAVLDTIREVSPDWHLGDGGGTGIESACEAIRALIATKSHPSGDQGLSNTVGTSDRAVAGAPGAPIAESRALLHWLASGARGLSSETMVRHLTGLECGRPGSWLSSRVNHPHDLDDLHRCEKLLREVPLLRPLLPQMATASPEWAALVPEWDSLVAEMSKEAPEWEEGRGSAPITYRRMCELLDPI